VNRAAALAAVVVLATPACKKRSETGEALATFRAYQEQMCACRDKTCADRVTADLQRWSDEMARNEREPAPPDETQLKQLQEVGTKLGECLTKLMGQGDAPAPPLVPGTKVRNADEILKRTYDELAGASVTEIQLSYVRADGAVDPTYGVAQIQIGRAKRVTPADDPSRPIGAPVPVDRAAVDDMRAHCPRYTWKDGARAESEGSCISIGTIERPRCSVVEVWKQAIEHGAPAQALAVLALAPANPIINDTQTWSFRVDDAPRDIHFSLDVPDVCAPTLEKPTALPPATGSAVKPNPY